MVASALTIPDAEIMFIKPYAMALVLDETIVIMWLLCYVAELSLQAGTVKVVTDQGCR